MVAVHVDEVALPLDRLVGCGGDDEAGLVDDGAGGAVLAGDPLRVDEGEGAGLDGDGLGGVEDLARSVGKVDGERNGRSLGAGSECGGAQGGQGKEAKQRHAGGSSRRVLAGLSLRAGTREGWLR